MARSHEPSDGAGARTNDAACAVALIIPVLNEAASIGSAVRSVPRDVVGRIIVADGGSSDNTAACATAAGAEVLDVGPGYGRACLLAAQAATDADIVVFMDGDGADDAQSIRLLVDPVCSGAADFVIGSRVRGKREPGSMSWHQVAAGTLAGFAMKLLYGVHYTDMCAFRAIRRDVLLGLGMSEMTYGWNIEMQMRAARSGLRVVEIPVPYHRRTGGSSKVAGSLRGTLRAGVRIVATFIRVSTQAGPQKHPMKEPQGGHESFSRPRVPRAGLAIESSNDDRQTEIR